MKNTARFFAASALLGFYVQTAAADLDVFKERREALMEELDGRVAVLYGALAQHGGATEELFIQESNFYYLTGISEPGAALILAPLESTYQEILYLQSRDPDVENWNGRREPLCDVLES